MVDTCGQCRFWKARSDSAKKTGGGYCRRFPPSFPAGFIAWAAGSGRLADITVDSSFLNDSWPMVHQQSWCGEFQKETSDGQ